MVLLCAGWLLLLLGGIGVLLPVLPTTPFVLLAAGCFSCTSPRLYAYLERSRLFGPYIENRRTRLGVEMAVKVRSLVLLWTLLIVSMVSSGRPWVTVLLLCVGAAVTAHLLMLKTRRTAALAEAAAQPDQNPEGF